MPQKEKVEPPEIIEDSLSIECCYLSEDGSFTQETYDTLVHTLAWLIDKYDLSVEDILRHYDCGGFAL